MRPIITGHTYNLLPLLLLVLIVCHLYASSQDGTWSTKALCRLRIMSLASAPLNGKLYVVSGTTSASSVGSDISPHPHGTNNLATTEAYESESDNRTSVAPMPTARIPGAGGPTTPFTQWRDSTALLALKRG